MSEMLEEQTCPYCGYTEEDCHSHWDETPGEVKCSSCYEEYHVTTHYQFLGFETQKICKACNEPEEDCFCDEEEVEGEEQ